MSYRRSLVLSFFFDLSIDRFEEKEPELRCRCFRRVGWVPDTIYIVVVS